MVRNWKIYRRTLATFTSIIPAFVISSQENERCSIVKNARAGVQSIQNVPFFQVLISACLLLVLGGDFRRTRY